MGFQACYNSAFTASGPINKHSESLCISLPSRYLLLYLVVVLVGIHFFDCWMCQVSRCWQQMSRSLRGHSWSSSFVTCLLTALCIPRYLAVCLRMSICLVMIRCFMCMFSLLFICKKRRMAFRCIHVGKRRQKKRRKRLIGTALLLGTFSTFTMFGPRWSTKLKPVCMSTPLPRRHLCFHFAYRGG